MRHLFAILYDVFGDYSRDLMSFPNIRDGQRFYGFIKDFRSPQLQHFFPQRNEKVPWTRVPAAAARRIFIRIFARVKRENGTEPDNSIGARGRPPRRHVESERCTIYFLP